MMTRYAPLNSLRFHCPAFGEMLSPGRRNLPYEFHILRSVREKYDFEETLFAFNGNVILPNYRAVRLFAQKMNEKRDLQRHPEQAIRAGQLNAMGLIDEISHHVLRLYEDTVNPGVFRRAVSAVAGSVGKTRHDDTMLVFTTLFPPASVYAGRQSSDAFLAGMTDGKAHGEIALEELLLLYFANINPAFAPFRELFDDRELIPHTTYEESMNTLESFFRLEKPFGPDQQALFDLLRAPILASPYSLEGQLAFIRERWGMLLPARFRERLLGAGDLIKEDSRIIFPGGHADSVVPTYPRDADGAGNAVDVLDLERFTSDLDWMPKVVLLAKNTHVWLDQLSKQYRRSITRLDEIPDEELDRLARWNFTGLWLIGVWERSPASRTIKQRTGNPEAVSSAYSIYTYDIAGDLGGEDAFNNLKHRAWQRGIRLAGDMVPNHMGIYSRWVTEHPEYFIQSSYSPFPNYRFTGADLSSDPSVQLRIEDGFWNRTDAAVVFQRIDNGTGAVSYLYHGNDGTNMPWNDTAQLNFLLPYVREAVVQTIFHVARKFSIIRFDAAMTLTRKHFQRLWYPPPGSGGDIPSRADHAMTKDDFDRQMPTEFWRELVDRINHEMPHTLLLAEAFWMLEGYFVRTLGMHRVYNSAFMHMLMREENAKYREAIRNTLHFNPEILKRYVNFMSNPDEQTAIAQFGKDDKYFGTAVMMVTLPGLPMIGHGQIEGYHEKYGMEYRRAYYDEWPDEHMVARHEREVFPLMQKRHLFSQVTHFELYDFVDVRGHVNENVFVYSNKSGGERSLVCFHNKFEDCSGHIKRAVGKTLSGTDEGEKNLVFKTLGEALELGSGDGIYYVFREHISNLEYLRTGAELHAQGLYVELRAFQYQVFLDFREVHDDTGDYRRLAMRLGGQGVPDVSIALRELQLAPVHDVFRNLFAPEALREFQELVAPGHREIHPADGIRFANIHRELAACMSEMYHANVLPAEALKRWNAGLDGIREYCSFRGTPPAQKSPLPEGHLREVPEKMPEDRSILLYAWLCFRPLRLPSAREEGRGSAVQCLDELMFGRVLEQILPTLGIGHDRVQTFIAMLRIALAHDQTLQSDDSRTLSLSLRRLLDDYDVRAYLGVNEHNGIWYFSKERFAELVELLGMFAIIGAAAGGRDDAESRRMTIGRIATTIQALSDASGYRVEDLRLSLTPGALASRR